MGIFKKIYRMFLIEMYHIIRTLMDIEFFPISIRNRYRTDNFNDLNGHLEIHKTAGVSMYPTISTGDILISGKVFNLKKGRIYGVSNGDSITVHRLKHFNYKSKEMVTKGDNNDISEKNEISNNIFEVKKIVKHNSRKDKNLYNFLNKMLNKTT